MNLARASVGTLACVAALACAACSYALKGRVVEGDASYAVVVSSDDLRLSEGRGLTGASLNVEIDPMKLNRKSVGRTVSGVNGMFEVPVDEVGAGLLDYDAAVFVRRKGCEPAEGYFKLPGGSKRLLVVLCPGKDAPTSDEGDDAAATINRYMK